MSASIALLIAHGALAQSTTSALINRQLDTRQDLDLSGTLSQAADLIEKKTGVHIDVDPQVWDVMPWGRDTTVAATVRNAPLRDALQAITAKLGLSFRLTDQSVHLGLEPALDRLGRRAELPELDVLAMLRQTPMPAGSLRITVEQLTAAIDHELEARKSSFAIEDRAADAVRSRLIDLPRNATLHDALDEIPRQTTATWYPSGKTLFIVPKRDVVQRRLGRHVTARYDGVDVPQVVLELFQREAVPFEIEPGAFARLAADHRAVHLMLQDASLRDALQSIGGETGLNFETTDRGVFVWNQLPAEARERVATPTTKPATTQSKPATTTAVKK